jgi:uncharacterized protein YigA (DUF484 family)
MSPDPIPESEERIIRYLHANPDLFTRHPDLLAEIRVPHRCGRAVSLVEHQVEVLREQSRRLKRQLRELIQNGRENQAFVQRLLELSLSLFQGDGVGDVLGRLYRGLSEDFGVDAAAVRLFKPPRASGERGRREFAEMDEDVRAMFERILAIGKPVCGRLQSPQLEYLFGEQRRLIGSSAVLPLGERGGLGLLAIGSRDPARFHPAQATDLLGHVGKLVTHAIRPHLAAA